ncbi:MAG: DUF4845 domain-containing protein [Pseudohongiellaceae bacterium]
MKEFRASKLTRQAGASKLGLLMTFVMIAAVLSLGLKVGPLYLDHNIVTSYTETLFESGEMDNLTTSQLRRKVGDNLRINNVNDFDTTAIRLSKENEQPVVTIAYEKRVELFLNLDVVAKFDTVLQ